MCLKTETARNLSSSPAVKCCPCDWSPTKRLLQALSAAVFTSFLRKSCPPQHPHHRCYCSGSSQQLPVFLPTRPLTHPPRLHAFPSPLRPLSSHLATLGVGNHHYQKSHLAPPVIKEHSPGTGEHYTASLKRVAETRGCGDFWHRSLSWCDFGENLTAIKYRIMLEIKHPVIDICTNVAL